MKTHLPHKLRAALMAALASVSLTSYAAAANLTWSEPGTASSLNEAKWSNGPATELNFTAGDNAIFQASGSESGVGCQGGTIHADNVTINNNTTVAGGAAIYSSGTVTIGEGNTLTLDGSELHISNAIKGGDGSTLSLGGSARSNIYWQGDYDVMMNLDFREVAIFDEQGDFVEVAGDHYAKYATSISKYANILDAHCGITASQLKSYIDNNQLNVYVGGDRGTYTATDTEEAYNQYGEYDPIPIAVGVGTVTECKTYFLNCDEDTNASIADICAGEHSDTNTVSFFGGWYGHGNAAGKATLELSGDKPVTIEAAAASFSTTNSGQLKDVILGAGKSWTLADGSKVTFPDWVITAKENSMLQSGADFGASDYNSSKVTMRNLKVEMRDQLIFSDDEVTLKAKLENVDIVNAEHGKLNVTQGLGARSVTCSGYCPDAGAEVNLLNIKDGADLALKELNISNGGKVGVYKNSTAGAGTNGDNVGNLTMAEGSKVVVGTYGGTLEANLTMESGSILDFTPGGTLTMNGNDVIAAQDTKFWLNSAAYADLYYGMDSNSIILFTDVSNIFSKEVEVTFFNADGSEYKVESLYFQTENGNAVLSTVKADLPVTPDPTPAAPEPTTGTLSLLALAGLAARRRRKH